MLHQHYQGYTVSAFAGKGKLAALNLLQESRKFQVLFAKFGEEFKFQDDNIIFKDLEEFVCMLYGSRNGTSTVTGFDMSFLHPRRGKLLVTSYYHAWILFVSMQ
jgi:hypothetical protein